MTDGGEAAKARGPALKQIEDDERKMTATALVMTIVDTP